MPDGPPPADGFMHRLLHGSIAAFIVYGMGAGLTYLSQLVIARAVGAESYGIYAYVIAWATILAYFATLGFDVSLLRLVPAYRAQQAWGLVCGVIAYAQRRVAAAGFGTVLAGALTVTLIVKVSPETTEAFLIGLLLVPVWALLWIRASVARAFGGVVSALAPDRLVRDGLVFSVVGLASLAHWRQMDAPFAMLVTLVASIAGLGLVSVAVRRLRPPALSGVKPEYDARTWRRAALPLVLIAVAETAMNRTGIVLFGWMGHTKEAGIFALAFNVTALALLPRMAVNALLAPMVSELFVKGSRTGLQELVTKASLGTFLGAIAVAVPLALLADPLLAWFGPDFVSGAPALRVLLVGQVAAGAAGSQLFFMTMTGHERAAAAILVLCVLANGVLTIPLMIMFGLTGAAVASSAMLLAWNVAMAFFVWRKLHLVPGILTIFPRLALAVLAKRKAAVVPAIQPPGTGVR
jgi:O-antigen/teichoic acid export membrane protein